jgi:hypothetical protein
MPAAMSPRTPPPRLTSTVKEQYGTPRRTKSRFEAIALGRGYTVKAGASRRERLDSNRGRIPRNTPPSIIEIVAVNGTTPLSNDEKD